MKGKNYTVIIKYRINHGKIQQTEIEGKSLSVEEAIFEAGRTFQIIKLSELENYTFHIVDIKVKEGSYFNYET